MIMMWKNLKLIRVFLSVIIFVSVCFMYLDIANLLPPEFSILFTSLQIIPSIVKLFFYAGTATLGLFFVILITFLFGRIYCSGICPLGTYQDFIIRIAKMDKKRKWVRYRKPHPGFHYVLLMILVFSVLSGSMFLLNLFEPFSNIGRMMNSFIKPVMIYLNNALAILLTRLDVFIIYPVNYQKIVLPVLGVILALFSVITVMSYFYGRLFCNLLCPAGAFLGLLSRYSLFRMVINEQSCTHCNLCEKVCKANCINSSTQSLDFASCVACFNCMEACHTDGVVYEFAWKKISPKPESVDLSRRRILQSSALAAVAAIVPFVDTSKTVTSGASGFEESRKHPITPPGSIGHDHFSSLCTACQLCVTSCPTMVLQPAFFEYGFSGILQPKMDYDLSYCNYDCTICTEICPTGAILPLTTEDKKLTQLGKAKFYKEDCIVITKKKDCGACSEHCPTKAVNMVLTDGVFLPVVQESICTGCGACEHACPTTPRKAIYVESNKIHLRAEKPKINKTEKKTIVIDEFPF